MHETCQRTERVIWLWLFTGVVLLVSFTADSEKTFLVLRMAVKKIVRIIPAILTMLILVSVTLYLIPEELISRYLVGRNLLAGTVIAAAFGSITLMPGFIAFPLSGMLLGKGVPYMVLSALTATMMLVGVVTFPIEKEFLGIRVAFIRNMVGLFIALAVALAVGIIYGEIGF